MRLGGAFVGLQMCYVLNTAIDPFLVNSFRDSSSVAYLNVLRRPFDLMSVSIALFTTALWPVYARLDLQREWRRLRRALYLPFILGMSVCLVFLGLVLLNASFIYDFLGRGKLNPTHADIRWVGLQVIATVAVSIVTVYFNAIRIHTATNSHHGGLHRRRDNHQNRRARPGKSPYLRCDFQYRVRCVFCDTHVRLRDVESAKPGVAFTDRR